MNKHGHSYEDVKELYSHYIHNTNDIELIDKAYKYAEEKHAGQFRKSGDPYITHLIEVAYILASLQAGPTTIAAGLLHDTIEDCEVTKEELGSVFDDDISEMVFCLTKIKALSHKRRHDKDFVAEGHRKIFLGMAKDIRVILIKLADRLHNMRTLEFQTQEKKIRIAKETLDVYCPIADRLGLNSIKGELEDLCLKYLNPEKWNEIQDYLNKNLSNRETQIKKLQKKIADIILKTDIPFEISARVKHPYSIYKKLTSKEYSFDQIYDIMALRIITETELNCYEILGIIHTEFKPLPGRFKDYIAVPKPNMYQSLHTTIIDNDGIILEVQIRTKEMDEIAEGGVAAHWRYKEGEKYDPKKEQREVMEKLHWFSEFVSMSDKEDDATEYMNTLMKDIFEANIYCFTPHGKVIDLPTGSTPLDFAYKVHTKVGDSAVGAIVNNTLVPLSTILQTGDVVEIKTSKTSNGPNEGWLKIVKTNQAKSHIRKYLLKKNADFLRENNIEKGRESLTEHFKDFDINEQKMESLINQNVLEHFSCLSLDDLYVNIATKTIQPSDITKELGLKKEDYLETLVKKNTKRNVGPISNQAVLVKGTPNILCSLSSCCSPIPGDNIIGYISKGKGVKIHRVDCKNILKQPARTIDVEWNPEATFINCPVELEIKSSDRENLLMDILNTLSQLKVVSTKVNAKSHPQTLTSTINVTILVNDAVRLRNIINSLVNVDGVYSIERATH
ncbi:MAG: RelA/SpoT family protein [Bacilli bacterium]